jgi:hypothetical protein
MWRIRSIPSGESDTGIDQDTLTELREKRSNVIDELSQIVAQRPADEVKIQVS